MRECHAQRVYQYVLFRFLGRKGRIPQQQKRPRGHPLPQQFQSLFLSKQRLLIPGQKDMFRGRLRKLSLAIGYFPDFVSTLSESWLAGPRIWVHLDQDVSRTLVDNPQAIHVFLKRHRVIGKAPMAKPGILSTVENLAYAMALKNLQKVIVGQIVIPDADQGLRSTQKTPQGKLLGGYGSHRRQQMNRSIRLSN